MDGIQLVPKLHVQLNHILLRSKYYAHCSSLDEGLILILDRSHVGGGNIADHDIEVESEWSTLRTNLIEHYMHCFKQNSIQWV